MNDNIIVINKKSRPYKDVTWDRITMIFKLNYNNIFHPTNGNIGECEVILSQGLRYWKFYNEVQPESIIHSTSLPHHNTTYTG